MISIFLKKYMNERLLMNKVKLILLSDKIIQNINQSKTKKSL